MSGRHRSFAELEAAEIEGRDWQRSCASRGAVACVIAPHGGGIEAGTSEVAREIAGDDLDFYSFEGLRRQDNRRLHISSTRFDDPVCLALVARASRLLAIHGCAGSKPFAIVGGLDLHLRDRLVAELVAAGFATVAPGPRHGGVSRANLCNRGSTGRGAQLELSRGLRQGLFAGLGHHERQHTTPTFLGFCRAVRAALLAHPIP